MAQVERATSTGGTTYLTNTSDRQDLVGDNINIPVVTPTTVAESTSIHEDGTRGIKFGVSSELGIAAKAFIATTDKQYLTNGTIGIPTNEQIFMTIKSNDVISVDAKTELQLAADSVFVSARVEDVNIYAGDGYATNIGSGNDMLYALAISNFTTANAANVYINPLDGQLFRSTSAKKYKKDIEDITLDYADNFFYKAKPKWYRSKCEADENKSYYGYIADEVAEFEPRLVQYGKDNEPEGFSYDRVCALLHTKMLEQDKIIKDLQKEVEKLKKG